MGEESIFQTILYNSKRFSVANDCRRYINWDRGKSHSASPETIKVTAIDQLLTSRTDFARKFDINEDTEVLDRIDEFLNSQSDK